MYTMDLTKLLKSGGGGGEPGSVVSAVLKHVHGLIPYYSVLPKSSKILVRNLMTLWSSHKEESVRVLSFMCILRLARRVTKITDIETLLQFWTIFCFGWIASVKVIIEEQGKGYGTATTYLYA